MKTSSLIIIVAGILGVLIIGSLYNLAIQQTRQTEAIQEVHLNGSDNTLYCDSFDIIIENGTGNQIIRS